MRGGSAKPLRLSFNVKSLTIIIALSTLLAAVLIGYVAVLFGYVAPSYGEPFHIVHVGTCDANGATKTSFSRGEMVMVMVNVTMAQQYYYQYYWQQRYYYTYYYFVSARTPLVIVKVMKGSTPVFLGSLSSAVSPGGWLNGTVAFTLESDAPTGTYTVTVYVWNGWLSRGGGVPIADNSGEVTAEFTVG